MKPDERLVPVIRSADPGLLPVVKATLEAAGIPFLVQGDHAAGLLPIGGVSGLFRGEGFGATILVPEERYEEARALLADRTELQEGIEEPPEDEPPGGLEP